MSSTTEYIRQLPSQLFYQNLQTNIFKRILFSPQKTMKTRKGKMFFSVGTFLFCYIHKDRDFFFVVVVLYFKTIYFSFFSWVVFKQITRKNFIYKENLLSNGQIYQVNIY